MGQAWLGSDAAGWLELGRLEKFLVSCEQMLGGGAGIGAVTPSLLLTVELMYRWFDLRAI